MARKKDKKKSKGKHGKKKKTVFPDGFDTPNRPDSTYTNDAPGYDYLEAGCPDSRMVWF